MQQGIKLGTIIAIALVVTTQSYAADIAVDTHVERVTVYRQSGVVTRIGEATIPEGTHRLVIKGLPAGIDSKTLRVEVAAQSARLGGIEISTVNEGKFVSETERELRRKLEDKQDQRAVIQDEAAAFETQLKLMESLAANPSGSATKSAVDGTNLAGVLATIGTSSTTAHSRIRDTKLRLRSIDREIETINADLKKVATQRKQSTELRASLSASAASTSTVSVSYSVASASWDWVYQARLDTTKKRVSLERQGQVEQSSGEDWKNVALTLSNAEPVDDAMTPVVNSLFVNLAEPEPAPRYDRKSAKATGGGAVELETVIVTAQKRESADISATQYATEYKIPGRVTLMADREPRLYLVAEDGFDTNLIARVIPSASRAAYLEATFKYELEVPIDGGELQLYRDGVFVGSAETRTFLPGADVRIPFGVDERIRVVLRDEAAQSGQRGMFNKQTIREVRQRIEITNYHNTAMPIEVIDRLPVSKHADVYVELLKGASEPTTKDLDGKSGVLLWKIDAPPQKMVAIRHYYSVRHPKDRELEASDEAE